MEDLGDDLYFNLLARDPSLEAPLYQAALDTLVQAANNPRPRPAPIMGQRHYRKPRVWRRIGMTKALIVLR